MKISLLFVCLSLSILWAQESTSDIIQEIRQEIEQVEEELEQQEKQLDRLERRGSSERALLQAEKQLIFLEVLYDELQIELKKLEKKQRRIEREKKDSARRTSKKTSKKTLSSKPKVWLGISVEEIPAGLRKILGLEKNSGVLIQKVTANSPAEKAGLKRLDVILSCDGQEIRSIADFRKIIGRKKPSESLLLNLIQKGKEIEIEVNLGQRKRSNAPPTNEKDDLEDFLNEVLDEKPIKKKIKKNDPLEEWMNDSSPRKERISRTQRNKRNSGKRNASADDLLDEFTQSDSRSKISKKSNPFVNGVLDELTSNPETQKALFDTAEKGLAEFFGEENEDFVKGIRGQAENLLEGYLENPNDTNRLMEDTQEFMQRFIGEDGELHSDVQGILEDVLGENWENSLNKSLERFNNGEDFDAEYFFENLLEENPEQLRRLLNRLEDNNSDGRRAGVQRFFERALDKASERKNRKENLQGDIDDILDDILNNNTPKRNIEVEEVEEEIERNEIEEVEEAEEEINVVKKPYLGFKLHPISPVLRAQLDLDETVGILVGKVSPKGPAKEAGLQRGDVILKINDTSIQGLGDISRIMRQSKIGDRLSIFLNRRGTTLEKILVIGAK